MVFPIYDFESFYNLQTPLCRLLEKTNFEITNAAYGNNSIRCVLLKKRFLSCRKKKVNCTILLDPSSIRTRTNTHASHIHDVYVRFLVYVCTVMIRTYWYAHEETKLNIYG